MKGFLEYLRIAFSAACLIACVLLIALWVRSLWGGSFISGPGFASKQDIRLGVIGGYLLFDWESDPEPMVRYHAWHFENGKFIEPGPHLLPYRFYYRRDAKFLSLYMPFCIVAFVPAALVTLPWIPWSKRYSLRTLLIATTLVAIALGLIVWLR